jgi:hypothetical protein
MFAQRDLQVAFSDFPSDRRQLSMHCMTLLLCANWTSPAVACVTAMLPKIKTARPQITTIQNAPRIICPLPC